MSKSDRIPRFRRGTKLRFDKTRSTWVVLAPERLFMPDEIGTEILKLVDGQRSIRVISLELAGQFNAPLDVVEPDVIAVLEGLVMKGAMEL
ncbi:pyrroloquinoline quinone biosynthesis peptide chaperone PqqD [Aquisediminimonas sediminicola]|uniref:pyrroloquinoline quinone biosynthesis peptide chaperone PqqD n=1 Tax=Alteraquisediminimonas sediminicola TaxID=2676787 RepID=UPI001C8DF6B0|nr:pyrroloquinoline quinone biosynthesis peptide chaperone PqqD [Aquisediminimonas sediminicola]